jgi:O-antigen/teichoic acid export membrane protein
MLLRQTALYLPAQLLAPLAQFVAVIAWTHYFAPAEFGALALAMALQELVFLATLSWWSHYTARYLAGIDSGDGALSYQRTENGALLAALLAQILAAGLIVGSGIVDGGVGLFIAMALFMVGRSLGQHVAERARAMGRIDAYSLIMIGGMAGGMAVAHLLIVMVAASPAVALVGMGAVSLLTAAIAWRWLAPPRAGVAFDRARFAHGLAYGMPLLVSGAIAWLSLNLLRFVVEHGISAEMLGLISVGWGLGQRAIAVAAMLVTAAGYPLAVRRMEAGDRDGAFDQVARNNVLLAAILVPGTAGLILLAPALVGLMVAPAYQAMTLIVLPIAAIAAALRNLRVHTPDQIFLLSERSRDTILLNGVECALTLIGTLLGLWLGGAVGACLGTLAGAAGGLAVGTTWAIRAHGMRLLLLDLAKIGVATVAMTAVLLWFRPAPSVVSIGLAIGLGAAVFGAALALLAPARVREIVSRLRSRGGAA